MNATTYLGVFPRTDDRPTTTWWPCGNRIDRRHHRVDWQNVLALVDNDDCRRRISSIAHFGKEVASESAMID